MSILEWSERARDWIDSALYRPLIGGGLALFGVELFVNLGSVPNFIPEWIIITASVLALAMIASGLLIIFRWFKHLL